MNEELSRQILEKYFSDFKAYHLLILVGFTILVTLIQIIQSIWLSRKIEHFKSDLKKSEIKFSAYNQIQIQALSNAYQILTEFLGHTLSVKNEINSESIERIKSISLKWLDSYGIVYSTFTKNKYILPISTKIVFSSMINDLFDMSKYVETEKKRSSMYHIWESGEVEFMGDNQNLEELYKKLNTIDKEGIINKTIKNINSIREEIENYFEKIE